MSSAAALAGALGVDARRDIAIRRRDDLLEHSEIDVVEVLEIQADEPGGVRAETLERLRMGADAVGEVDDRRRLPRCARD